MELLESDLTERIIGSAIEVHKALGPGLLESAYESCLCHELQFRGISFQRQVPQDVVYKGFTVDCGYRLDLIVEERVILELKAVERLVPIHEAQLITYLRLSGIKVGLLMNFNIPALRDGIVRRVLSALPR